MRSPGKSSGVRGEPTLLKWAYCLVLLFAVLPLGLAGSSWVALARGGIGSSLPLLGILPMLVLAVYRIYLVARGLARLACFAMSSVD